MRYVLLFLTSGGLIAAFAGCSLIERNPASVNTVQYYTSEPQRAPIYFDEPTDEPAKRTNKNRESPASDDGTYDVVVIGGQLAGWSATYGLARHHLHVLDLVSSDDELVGQLHAIAIADGEAIIDRPPSISAHDREISEVFRRFFNPYNKKIPQVGEVTKNHAGRAPGAINSPYIEPVDAYYFHGVFYNHMWDDNTLKKLPPDFAVFKRELYKEFKGRMIGTVPLETSAQRHYHLDLDQMNAAKWIESMPEDLRERSDQKSQKIYMRYHDKNFVSAHAGPPMKNVLAYANLVCLTRAGTECRNLSALYVAKIMLNVTHMVRPLTHAAKDLHRLRRRLDDDSYVTFRRLTRLTSIMSPKTNDITIDYTLDGRPHEVHAHAVIWAMSLQSAPGKIEGFATAKAYSIRKQVQLIRDMNYAPIMRYNIVLNGRPFFSSYQIWWNNNGPTSKSASSAPTPTSFLLPEFFNDLATDSTETVTLLEPLPINMSPQILYHRSKLAPKTVASLASHAVANWAKTFQSLFYSLHAQDSESLRSGAIDLQSVHVSRMPASVPIVGPGHFIYDARFLARPFGHVYFASPDIGIPTFEEAVFRAHCAVRHVLLQLQPKDFSLTRPSRCPND